MECINCNITFDLAVPLNLRTGFVPCSQVWFYLYHWVDHIYISDQICCDKCLYIDMVIWQGGSDAGSDKGSGHSIISTISNELTDIAQSATSTVSELFGNASLTIMIIMSLFLERLSMWNMLTCAEQVQIQKYKTHGYKTPKTAFVQTIVCSVLFLTRFMVTWACQTVHLVQFKTPYLFELHFAL